MRLYRPGDIAFVLVLLALASTAAFAADAFQHDDWSKVLGKFVDQRGYVDYEALAKDHADFDRYVAAIEKTGPKNAPAMFPTKNDQLAYYLNAYNAQVWKGVLARGPEKESVWTGGLLPGRTGYAFFKGRDIMIGGETTNLKALEDDVVRGQFKDPRVHAALNCASKGCPRLPQTAFEGAKLDQQLDAGMTEFVAEKRNCTVDDTAKTVTLSKIFDWFSADFLAYEKRNGTAEPNQIDYVNRYRAAGAKIPRTYAIRFFDYDKDLNKQYEARPRGRAGQQPGRLRARSLNEETL